jgi:hypothetical protein
MKVRRFRWILSIAAVSLITMGGCQPTGFVVPDEVSCDRCEIRVDPEVEIGDPDGSGSLLGRPTHLAIDSSGHIWVTMLDHGFPYVFDSDGNFVQEFGRAGSGPGEFRHARVIAALPGDSVLLHAFPSYLVVGPELTVARVVRGSSASYTDYRIVSWPQDVVASKTSYADGSFSTQVLTLDFMGELIGESRPLVSVADLDQPVHRRPEPSSSGGMWVSEVARYLLRLYASDGTPLDSLERRPDWFPANQSYGFPMPDQAPSTVINAVRSDTLGRLWVYIDIPQQDWRSAWQGFSFPTGASEVRVSSLPPSYKLYRTTVEVIDPERRRVIARAQLDGHAVAVLGSDRVATYIELESGVPVATIHKLTLIRR